MSRTYTIRIVKITRHDTQIKVEAANEQEAINKAVELAKSGGSNVEWYFVRNSIVCNSFNLEWEILSKTVEDK